METNHISKESTNYRKSTAAVWSETKTATKKFYRFKQIEDQNKYVQWQRLPLALQAAPFGRGPINKRIREPIKKFPPNVRPEPTLHRFDPKPQRIKRERPHLKVKEVIKAAPKVIPKVAKPPAKVVKPEIKEVKSHSATKEHGPTKSSPKSEDKTQEAKPKKKASSQPSVEPNAEGHYEVNPLMSKVLDTELQNIMIKVRQELPTEPPTEAEKLVANKFRNEAGEDLRNVLGLAVTQRLLNVFNPLFVKVEFNRKPENMYLKKFIRACNCTSLKRLRNSEKIYVAQIGTIVDYDRLCGVKRLRCGDAKATITPCYKFTLCPEKVKTVYSVGKNEQKENADAKDTDNTEKTTKTATKQNIEKKQSDASDNKAQTSEKTLKTPNEKPNSTQNVASSNIETKNQTKIDEKGQINVAKAKTVKKTVSNAAKTQNKKIGVKNANTKSAQKDTKPNDFDELDDEDILTLISDGIILDECSGSDKE